MPDAPLHLAPPAPKLAGGEEAARRLLESVDELPTLVRLNGSPLPSRENVAAFLEAMLQLVFPGYFGRQALTKADLRERLTSAVLRLREELYDHVRFCLRYKKADRASAQDHDRTCGECDHDARQIVDLFFDALPDVRRLLAEDVNAAFDFDPAATSTDETIFCYPGILAITVQRLAHVLHGLGVPLLPRVWTEWAHGRTGIEIHPAAKLGRRLFIDHGTGIVIGETCAIGDDVKLYQGVTLGALAPVMGQRLRGTKRHPTIGDNVVLYAGATVLGGDTVIGAGCTIGGNVFLTSSVPPGQIVMNEPPTLRVRDRSRRKPLSPVDRDGSENLARG